MKIIPKPTNGEYAPYAIDYIKLTPENGAVIDLLKTNAEAMKKLMLGLPAEKLLYRYAEGKWTIKEIWVHIIDGERVFAYRALRIARNDKTPLPGYEQDDYTTFAGANERHIDSIAEEYDAVRASTIAMLNGFNDEVFTRTGTASGHTVSVRSLAHQIAGHEMHHMNILKERYLK